MSGVGHGFAGNPNSTTETWGNVTVAGGILALVGRNDYPFTGGTTNELGFAVNIGGDLYIAPSASLNCSPAPLIATATNNVSTLTANASQKFILVYSGLNPVNIDFTQSSLLGNNLTEYHNFSPLTGQQNICTNSSGLVYSTTMPGINTYAWSVPRGLTIVGSTTTSSITVNATANFTSPGVIIMTGTGANQVKYVNRITVMPSGYNYATDSRFLRAKYNFSGNLQDATGNVNLTVNGSNIPLFVNDRFGNPMSAISFTGTLVQGSNGGSYYVFNTLTGVTDAVGNMGSTGRSFSFSLWFKTNSTVGGILQGITTNSIGNWSPAVYLMPNGGIGTNSYLTSSGPTSTATYTSGYNDYQWHHVVVTYSRTSAATANPASSPFGVRIYLDGRLEAQNYVGIYNTNYVGGANFPIIGAHPGAGNNVPFFKASASNINVTRFFNGALDEVGFYTCELGYNDVLNLYGAKPSFTSSAFCGGNLQLSASSAIGTTSNLYTWSGPKGFSSAQQNPIVSNANILNSGFYNLTINNGCISNSFSTFIPVGGTSGSTTLTGNVVVNPSDIVTYTASQTTTTGIYTWTVPSGMTVVSTSGSSIGTNGTSAIVTTSGNSIQLSVDASFNGGILSTSVFDFVCRNSLVQISSNISKGVLTSNLEADNEANDFVIYPNPNSGNFTINSKKVSYYQIYKLEGGLQQSGNLNVGLNTLSLNLGKGFYILKVGNTVRKLLIE